MSSGKAIDVVQGCLQWFNEVMATPGYALTEEEVARHFTADARMIANGQLKCAGIHAHLEHFIELQHKLKSVRIRLPFEYSITSQDDCAAYYKLDYVTADGATGVVHDSALWKVRDGKIELMVETVYFEGREVPLENHP